MKDELKQRKNQEAIVKLAIFFFVFLGMEYMFDNQMAFVTDSAGVVLAQNVVLGVSAVGFCYIRCCSAYSMEKKGFLSDSPWLFPGCAAFFLSGSIHPVRVL